MAFAGKLIHNKKTGQQLNFIQTSKDTEGKLIELIAVYPPKSQEPPIHYHPYQDEYFEILNGKMTIRIGDKIRKLTKGEKIYLPKGEQHSMWNESDKQTEVNWKVVPALQTEYFMEMLSGLANDNKTK